MDGKTEATVEINVASSLRELLKGLSIVQAKGTTVRHLLDNLNIQFPGVKERMIDKWGELRSSILIRLNDEDIRSLQGLETPVKEGDFIGLFVVLAGG